MTTAPASVLDFTLPKKLLLSTAGGYGLRANPVAAARFHSPCRCIRLAKLLVPVITHQGQLREVDRAGASGANAVVEVLRGSWKETCQQCFGDSAPVHLRGQGSRSSTDGNERPRRNVFRGCFHRHGNEWAF